MIALVLAIGGLLAAAPRRARGVGGTIQEEIDHETKLREAAP